MAEWTEIRKYEVGDDDLAEVIEAELMTWRGADGKISTVHAAALGVAIAIRRKSSAEHARADKLTEALEGTRAVLDTMNGSDLWRQIETAPKDRTRILVCRATERGYERDRIGVDWRAEGVWQKSRLNMHPTHWMPLPEPPATAIASMKEQTP